MKVMLFGACCAFAVITQAHGVESAASGAGAERCAVFTQNYQRLHRQTEDLYFTWAQGFMSGVNDVGLVTGQPIRDLNSVPISDQESQIRQYCEAHPLASYDQAVMQLYSSLKVSSFRAQR
jgi:hypothetical protein